MNHDEAEKLLSPYRDGELDLSTCLKLEGHLEGCAICQQRLAGEEAWVNLIQTETPRFAPSPFLKTRILAALKEEKSTASTLSWWRMFGPGALYATIGAFAVVVLAISVLSSSRGMPEVDEEAVANHVRSLQVNHLMDVASTDQHTVKPWFAGKLDYSPQVVDLTSSGYPLIGGRLDVLDHREVAAIIYQRRKHYINLFIWPSGAEGLNGRLYTLNGYHALGWSRSGMNYLAVSELGEKEMREFVKMIQDQTVDSRPGE